MKTILITGVAGFLGCNLAMHYLNKGFKVVGIDNFSSSTGENSDRLQENDNFTFYEFDINTCKFVDTVRRCEKSIDYVLNFACQASPKLYQADPIYTFMTCTIGVLNMLDIAKHFNATILHASTSEVYGDPEVSPQSEDYRGNVNINGIRSCYDEGKRGAEALIYDYDRMHGVDFRIIRIFNTYGPHMMHDDGRVISNFINQALQGDDITIYGDGTQDRSFCYVDDLVDGIDRLLNSKHKGVVNIGNPANFTMIELADIILSKIETTSKIVFEGLPSDDPKKRCPNIFKATQLLNWKPTISLSEGLDKTIEFFKNAERLSK